MDKISDAELLEIKARYKKEKGFDKSNCTNKELVEAVNLLLCHTGEITDLTDIVVGMKMFLERLGLENECFIAIYPGDTRPRFLWDEQPAEV